MLEPDFPGDLTDEAIYVPGRIRLRHNTDVQIRFPRGIATRP